uniref:Uncharacterized protein n=1 Tax=Arundo donax TaxID=35708 RepID=A0A0A9ARG1_ARUDO
MSGCEDLVITSVYNKVIVGLRCFCCCKLCLKYSATCTWLAMK